LHPPLTSRTRFPRPKSRPRRLHLHTKDVADPAPFDHVETGKGKEPARDNDKLPSFLRFLDDDASGPGRSGLFDHQERKSSFTRDDGPLVRGDRPPSAGQPDAPESRVLDISNIRLKASDKNVMAFLDGYNPVSLDRPTLDFTGHGMPYAYVLMLTVRDCERAVTERNGGIIGGQELIVEVASYVPWRKFTFNSPAQQSRPRLRRQTYVL
jgi:hypothetical protein